MAERPCFALMVVGEAVFVGTVLAVAAITASDKAELLAAFSILLPAALLGSSVYLADTVLGERLRLTWQTLREALAEDVDDGFQMPDRGELERLAHLKRPGGLLRLATRVRDSTARGVRYLLARPREPAVPVAWRGGPEAPLTRLVRLKRRGDFGTPGSGPGAA